MARAFIGVFVRDAESLPRRDGLIYLVPDLNAFFGEPRSLR